MTCPQAALPWDIRWRTKLPTLHQSGHRLRFRAVGTRDAPSCRGCEGASGQPRTWTTISRAAVNALHHHLSESRTPLLVPKSYPSHHLLSTGTRQHWRAVRLEAAALCLAILEPSHSLPVMEHPPSGRHLMSARLDTRTVAHVQVVETLSKLKLDLLRHALTIPPHASAPPGISQDDEQFNLDDTLRLTSIFIETVKSLHFPGSNNSSLCIQHHHHHQPDEVVVVMVDTASVFLVISCWHRPADIYDEIFVLTRGCYGSPCGCRCYG